jgi:glycine oxidase
LKPIVETDCLIVGQGIAGSSLAIQLLWRGKKVMVFDQPSMNKSSSVAAGLFNPIIGKVMTLAWKTELLYPALMGFYPKAEQFLASKFFHPIPLYRPFNSIFEQNEWMAQSADPFLKEFIDAIFLEPTFTDEVLNPFGGLLLKQCGYLDVPAFINATRKLLQNSRSYREEKFNEKALIKIEDGFEYGSVKSKKVIFCGGMMDKATDFFSWLPLRSLKGETLEIKLESRLNRIYNNGVYMAPSANDAIHYKVGATYDPKDQSEQITDPARLDLTKKLCDLLIPSYELISQEWGFRPCAGDRKPYVGEHPTQKNVYVLNGLGTKGVSTAPYFSGQLADFMDGKGFIDQEASIERIKKG